MVLMVLVSFREDGWVGSQKKKKKGVECSLYNMGEITRLSFWEGYMPIKASCSSILYGRVFPCFKVTTFQ